MRFIVQELMLCRRKSTSNLCLWPANAAMSWESHSSHFQITHKRPTFITSASKMQRLRTRFVGPHLSHQPHPSEAPLQPTLLPQQEEGGDHRHPTAKSAPCIEHPEDIEQEKHFEEENNNNLYWKKWHPENRENFCTTVQMSIVVKNEKHAKCNFREVGHPHLPSATALPK